MLLYDEPEYNKTTDEINGPPNPGPVNWPILIVIFGALCFVALVVAKCMKWI
jgi:hypothetical protein